MLAFHRICFKKIRRIEKSPVWNLSRAELCPIIAFLDFLSPHTVLDRVCCVFNFFIREYVMARVCQITGKKPMVGHQVSHANNKTKRRFLPNLQYRRFWVESENRWVRLRLTTAGLRTVDKVGIDAVLADLRARGEI